MKAVIVQLGLLSTLCSFGQPGSLKGIVWGKEKTRLDSAVVVAIDSIPIDSVRSNADGSYLIEGLPAGSYTMVFKRDGRRNYQVSGVEIKAHTITFMDVRLVRLDETYKRRRKRERG